MTENEKYLLKQLEEHASHFTNLVTLMNLFCDTVPFMHIADEQKRARSVFCYAGLCELATYYSQDIHNTVHHYYANNNL